MPNINIKIRHLLRTLLFAVPLAAATSSAPADDELSAHLPGKLEMRPLWDGKTFEGWERVGGGTWEIADGVIRGTSGKDEPRHGLLTTKDTFDDFVISLEFRARQGNSGLYFRAEPAEPHGVQGLQAEIDPEKNTGGLYETGGRGWVVQPTPAEVEKWYLPGAWNKLTVVAQGREVSVFVNGQRTAELVDDPGARSGRIALQLHGGQDMDVEFRNVKIAELPPAEESETSP